MSAEQRPARVRLRGDSREGNPSRGIPVHVTVPAGTVLDVVSGPHGIRDLVMSQHHLYLGPTYGVAWPDGTTRAVLVADVDPADGEPVGQVTCPGCGQGITVSGDGSECGGEGEGVCDVYCAADDAGRLGLGPALVAWARNQDPGAAAVRPFPGPALRLGALAAHEAAAALAGPIGAGA